MAAPNKRKGKEAVETPARNYDILFWVLIGAISIIFLVLAWPLFSGKFYTYDDLTNSNLPMKFVYASALKGGDSFLWAPQFYCGVYAHGESEVGMCHPLHLFLYRFFPLGTAYELEFLLSYAFMFFGMYYYLRYFKLEKAPASFGAMLFCFAGFNIWHFMHLAPEAVVAHIPWLLLADTVLLCSTDRRRVGQAQMGVVGLTVSQLLLGHPQFVFFSVLTQGAFILFSFKRWVSWGRPALLIAMQVLAVVIGAIQLLPVWDLVQYTDRSGADFDLRMAFSMHPLNLTQLVSPLALKERYFAYARWADGNTHEMGLYASAFCTLVFSWFIIRWRKMETQKWFLLAVMLFGVGALIFSLGKYGKVYPLFSELPGIRSLAFRAPTRYGLLLHLALAVLGGFALADLVRLIKDKEKVPWKNLWPLAIPPLLSLGTLIWVSGLQGKTPTPITAQVSTVEDAFTGLLLILAAAVFIGLSMRGFAWAPYAIVLLTGFEIVQWGLRNHVIKLGPPKTVQEVVDSVGMMPTNTGRLFYTQPTSVPVMKGYSLVRGNIGLVPAKKLPMDPASMPNSLRLAHVAWGLMGNGWGQLPDTMPRARMVSQVAVGTNVVDILKQINIATTALVDKPVEVQAGPPGTAEITKDRPGWIEIKTTAPTKQLLVLSESYHHGWQATVDGVKVPIVRAYGDFMAFPVEAGTKSVVMRFEPSSFWNGLKITLAGLAIAVCWFVGWFYVIPKVWTRRGTSAAPREESAKVEKASAPQKEPDKKQK